MAFQTTCDEIGKVIEDNEVDRRGAYEEVAGILEVTLNTPT
jgi:hypothetical protein